MNLDAIIIADSGVDSLSATNPLKLKIDGKVASVQLIKKIVKNGNIREPIEGERTLSWASAPKLNGIYLQSYLMQNGYNVSLINNYMNEKDRFTELLKKNPSAIIISTPFIFFKKMLRELVKDIRTLAPGISIIVGGSFVYYSYLLKQRDHEPDYETTAAKEDFLFLDVNDEPEVDLYIISPRGENTLCELIDKIKQNHSIKSLPNSAYLNDGEYQYTERVDDVSNVSFPKIDWDSLPDSIFQAAVIPLQASNGCPYNCAFCNFNKDRRFVFVKPLDQLIGEIKVIEKRGIKYVWFVDDNFRLGKDDLNEVCQRFIDEDIQVKWMCFIRASTLRNADMSLLKRAGCIEVQIGLESGDPEILKNMNKQVDPETYKSVIKELLENGINVSCYFISGFPGETEESVQKTREFIKSIEHPEHPGILSWSIYPFILSPLSPIYEPEMRKKYGLNGYLNKWEHKTMDYSEAKKQVVKTFLSLNNSGPIYREDNLDLIFSFKEEEKKKFYRKRYDLSKKSMRDLISTEELSKTFNNLF
ncbi:MAG: radical SAM protein [Cyclobacteriaceae bacterium]|nr:radical SAM protein [Cyclobacteriaceae bacterium]